MSSRSATLALLAVLLFVPSGAARAQDALPEADRQRASELFQNGEMLYREGRYEDAITAWKAAYELTQHPDLLYNMSSAYEKLGDYGEAITALNRYRAYAPIDEREIIERRLRSLEERLASRRAEVAVTPAEPAPQRVVVAPPPERRRGSVLPAVLLGTGAASFGAGGVYALQARAARGELEAQCAPGASGLLCPTSAQPAAEQHESASRVSAVALGLGGALTGVGLTTAFVLGGRGSADLTIAPSARGDGAALRVDGRF